MIAARAIGATRRVVIKLGTNVVTREEGNAATERLHSIVESIGELRRTGCEVVLVTSGAVGLGADALGAGSRASTTPVNRMKRACAAIGQSRLAALYQQAFEQSGTTVAQLLLTGDDFASPARARRLASTLETLLAFGAVPILNENDAAPGRTARAARTAERSNTHVFRDNDMLAALTARAIHAQLVVFLTDVDGVLSPSPVRTVIPMIEALTPSLRECVQGISQRGRGGMASKLDAALFAACGGTNAVIANGHLPGVIDRLLAGEQIGTFVPARKSV